MGPGRLHALIDGIFAIALTLLVLDLPKPAHSARLVPDLLGAWSLPGPKAGHLLRRLAEVVLPERRLRPAGEAFCE